MKKIIGLIMIAGISYGASVVTPPGIQVNGLATNNNVMVYSNGMLLDSGVAPTNLVSVTNLTADIEALSATNAAQDALIAGNLYAEGTTNKTLIDAAIAGTKFDFGDSIHIAIYPAQSQAYGNCEVPNLIPDEDFPSGLYGSGTGRKGIYLSWASSTTGYTFNGLLRRTSNYVAPETFGAPYLQDATGKSVYITKCAKGATGLDDFLKDASPNTLWQQFATAYTNNQTLNNAGPIDVIWYCQGESVGSDYANNMDAIISDIIADYGSSNTVVVLAGVGGFESVVTGSTVNPIFKSYADSHTNAVYFSSKDLPVFDGTHYTSWGHKMRGLRYAKATLDFMDDDVARTNLSSDVEIQSLVTDDSLTTYSFYERKPGGKGTSYSIVAPLSDNYQAIHSVESSITPLYLDSTAFLVRGIVVGSYYSSYSADVKLVDSSNYGVVNRAMSIRLSGAGSNGASTGGSCSALFNSHSGGTSYSALYGVPVKSSEISFEWKITINTNLTILADDVLECGGETWFVASKDNSGPTNTFMVRNHWNDTDDGALEWSPVSTSTPIVHISSGVTNTYATGAVTASSVASDYRNVIYAADDGWHMIPKGGCSIFYELSGNDTADWTWEEGD